MLSKVDDNDGLYTVAEYFRDISFGELKLEFSYGTRFYDDNLDNQNVFYSNLDYDITINWYPVKAFKTSDKFWPRCLHGNRAVVLSKNVDISIICHEMIHTFKISDLYSNKTDKNGRIYADISKAKTGCQYVTVIYYSFDKNYYSLKWSVRVNFR